jgi:hypothetical protein
MSNNEESFVVVTKNNKLYALSKFLQIENQIQLEEKDLEIREAELQWRFCSDYFSISYRTDQGTKSMTFSRALKPCHSNSLYDAKSPQVSNVFQFFDKGRTCPCQFTDNGNYLYGVCQNNDKGVSELWQWEKNGLVYKKYPALEAFGKQLNVLAVHFLLDELMLLHVRTTGVESGDIIFLHRENADWTVKHVLHLPSIC